MLKYICLIFIIQLPSTLCAQKTDLLKNGSFENKMQDWENLGYTSSNTNVNHGKLSAFFTGESPQSQLNQTIPLTPDSYYKVQFSVLFEQFEDGALVFDTNDRFDTTAQVMISGERQKKWLNFSRFFNSGEFKDVTLRFYLAEGFKGSFHIDGVRLEQVTKEMAEAPLPPYPAERMPSNIQRITTYGQRADISLDGKKVIYLTKAGGDIEQVDLESGEITVLRKASNGMGYFRALHMSNGDYLITGGKDRNNAYAYVINGGDLTNVTPLGILVREGPAVSRNFLKIAWTPDMDAMWSGEIVYHEGVPSVLNRKRLFTNREGLMKFSGGTCAHFEPQSFRPPKEHELIFNCYGYEKGGEKLSSQVFGYNTVTKRFTDYSLSKYYEEAEGIFPSGQYSLVESDAHNKRGTPTLDVYRFTLDGSGDKERLTFFNDTDGYRASNPVVSDDGQFMIFQEAREYGATGHGIGLLMYSFEDTGTK